MRTSEYSPSTRCGILHGRYLERDRMAGAGIRALDAKGHGSRAAFADELTYRESSFYEVG